MMESTQSWFQPWTSMIQLITLNKQETISTIRKQLKLLQYTKLVSAQ